MKIDLGCSRYKHPGYIGVDIDRVPGVQVLGDGRALPFKDSVLEGVYSHHCIEHINDQLSVIRELWRVCADGSMIELTMPHFSNPSYYDDLTHCYKYSTRSFEHYDQLLQPLTGHSIYLPEVDLRLLETTLNYWPENTIKRKSHFKAWVVRSLTFVINAFANANPFLCERLWCRWVGGFYEVSFRFEVVKAIAKQTRRNGDS